MKLVSIIRIIYVFSLFSLINCSNGQTNFHENNYELINLTKQNNELVIFKPCDASIRKIIIRKDTLFFTTNQDGVYTYSILKREKITNDKFSITVNTIQGRTEVFSFTKIGQLWDINGRVYAGIGIKDKYKYIEQACTDCFSKEECDEFEKNNLVDNNKEGVTLNTKGYNEESAILFVNKEWFGTYFFENTKAEIDYRITIRDKLILLKVESRHHGYSDQLKVVKVGDTLGLFYHKNISGMNYDDFRHYKFLKLYKSSEGKYFFQGKLPHLPNKVIEFEKVR